MENEDRNAQIALPVIIPLGAGIAWAGGQDGATVFGMPVFALVVGLAFLIQWLAFIPAYLLRTEKFFDIVGSLTYVSVTVLAVVLTPQRDGRSFLLMALVVIWAARLGLYLFRRVHKAGKDARFDEIKKSFSRFLMTWSLQGLWVTSTVAAGLAAITGATRQSLGWVELVGLLLWLIGFGVEVLADRQKSSFREDPANKGKFIQTGLWAWSRHPNYFGEIVLWIGVAIIALPVLRGWQLVTLISPLFVTLLLTRVSGIPMLEQRADEKWGGQAEYEAYKKNTPSLIPRFRPTRKS